VKNIEANFIYPARLCTQLKNLQFFCTRREKYSSKLDISRSLIRIFVTNESDIFGKSIVCGELIFWMAEVLNCVPKTEMESLLNKIIASGTAVKNGIIVYDRKRWNKEIQNLCFDKIANKIKISTLL
jgi:hypothetical protein